MSERLMDAADLERLTGKKRYSKQAEWFKSNFGVEVVRCADGSIIMTWTQFDALMARKAGTAPGGSSSTVELCYD